MLLLRIPEYQPMDARAVASILPVGFTPIGAALADALRSRPDDSSSSTARPNLHGGSACQGSEPFASGEDRQRRSRPAASPARNLFGLRNIDSTMAPFGERARWRLPLGRHT